MPAKRSDAAGEVYRLLSERIAAGEITPGMRLKESCLLYTSPSPRDS